VARLLVVQAGVAAAVNVPFSRRNTPVIVATLMLVTALCLLAVAAHTATPAARTAVLSVEVALLLFGLYRFFSYRYMGGTAFAIVIMAVLLHPAVARAYGAQPASRAGTEGGRGDAPVRGSATPIADPAGGAFGEPAGH
jgi:hypothetical protein